jgi:hypothetical protein
MKQILNRKYQVTGQLKLHYGKHNIEDIPSNLGKGTITILSIISGIDT